MSEILPLSKQQQKGGNANGYGNGYANGRQSQGAYQARGRNGSSWGAARPVRYEGSGANGTPLGTPLRMSPATPGNAPSPSSNDVQPAVTTTNGSVGVKEKDKKRKAEAVEEVKVCGRHADSCSLLPILMVFTRTATIPTSPRRKSPRRMQKPTARG